MFGSDMSRDTHIDHMHEITGNFFQIDEGDKLVDIAAGKHYVVVVT